MIATGAVTRTALGGERQRPRAAGRDPGGAKYGCYRVRGPIRSRVCVPEAELESRPRGARMRDRRPSGTRGAPERKRASLHREEPEWRGARPMPERREPRNPRVASHDRGGAQYGRCQICDPIRSGVSRRPPGRRPPELRTRGGLAAHKRAADARAAPGGRPSGGARAPAERNPSGARAASQRRRRERRRASGARPAREGRRPAHEGRQGRSPGLPVAAKRNRARTIAASCRS